MTENLIFIIIQVIFWVSVFFIIHSYVFYPLILIMLSRNKEENLNCFMLNDSLPAVSILMSLYNEEEVIKQKLTSILSNQYPISNIEILIGSDASNDNTNEIIYDFMEKNPGIIKFYPFEKRQGKANIINQLYDQAKGEILILTDANVIFDSDTIFELVKHFKNHEIGIVDTNMINRGLSKTGISIQEKAYISREVKMKNRESRIWGTMMGPFGGCYAIKRELFSKVPYNYLVDDFYINMKVLEKGKKSINNLNARVYEDVSNNLYIEFKRKIRIATGNFQNLFEFAHLMLPFNKGLSFSFISHKVIRWLGPVFLIAAFISNLLLTGYPIYRLLFIVYCLTFAVPIIDSILRNNNLHIIIFRFITHFYSMNLALLIGLIKYIKGVKSNVWQPTKRFQSK